MLTSAPFWIGAVGGVLAVVVLWDAFETILVPRRIGRRVRLTRYFYLATWPAWRATALAVKRPARREALLGFFGPISMLLLLALWAASLIVAFALLQFSASSVEGAGAGHLATMLYLSGETFFTLGFGDITPATILGRVLATLEAGLGFAFLGTVIGYLPTMYSAFAEREIEISLMDAAAGSPPTAAECLGRLDPATSSSLEVRMRDWERWSARLLETHISYPQLAYYRSQHLNQSWLGTLTAILDTSAILLASEGGPPAGQARLTFAMARHALVDIAQIFVPHYKPGAPDRLAAPNLDRLRSRLADTPFRFPATRGFETSLADLRLTYEPYAQALAAYLLVELPPWIHDAPRRDNWSGGPWDRLLSAEREPAHRSEEHF